MHVSIVSIAFACLVAVVVEAAGLAPAPNTEYAVVPWGALIGLGGSILGGFFNRKPKQTPEEKEALLQQSNLNRELATNLTTGRQYAAGVLPVGQRGYEGAERLYGQAEGAYAPAQNYFSRLMSGNRAATSALLAPEITRIRDRYRNVEQAARQLNPRGGGNVAQATEQPFQMARDVGELYAPARANAASGLLNVGAGLTNVGSGLANVGQGGYGAAGNFLSAANQAGGTAAGNTGNLLSYNTAARQDALDRSRYQYGVGKDIGGGLFGMLRGVNWGGIFGKGSGGRGATGGYGMNSASSLGGGFL